MSQIKTAGNLFQPAARGATRGRAHSRLHHQPQPLFDSWPEIRKRVQAARHLAVFLDFDGTLVRLRRRPIEVRVSRRIRRVLEGLARHSNVYVAIVSGRRLRDLQSMFGVERVHIFGLHGAERAGEKAALSRGSRRALGRAKRQARSDLGIMPGIWLEDKVLGLAVHYRGASPTIVREAHTALLRVLAPLRRNLSIMDGEKVWEILPREIAGKGATIQELLAARAARTLAIYAGDDVADEQAFAAIPDQITVQVGKKNDSCARYFLENPAEVLRFLARLERELT